MKYWPISNDVNSNCELQDGILQSCRYVMALRAAQSFGTLRRYACAHSLRQWWQQGRRANTPSCKGFRVFLSHHRITV